MSKKTEKPKAAAAGRVQEVALLGDAHWRSTIQSALRLVSWSGSVTPTPATILPKALAYVSSMSPSDFLRTMEGLDFSQGNKKGAVRVHPDQWVLVQAEAERLGASIKLTLRAVVIVALYSYSLHLLRESQLTLFRRIAAFLREELKDPGKRERAVAATGLTGNEIEALLAGRRGKFVIRGEAGPTFVYFSQMVEAIGASSPAIFHAATVASSEEDFLEMAGLRGQVIPFR